MYVPQNYRNKILLVFLELSDIKKIIATYNSLDGYSSQVINDN